MGSAINVNVRNEDELNQQLQLYLAQGYNMKSNFNGTAILNKKSYSVGLLIVLLILFFPAAIIYYLVASDDVVTIKVNGQSSSSSNIDVNPNCGQGLFEDSKFCPGCGSDLTHQD